MKTENQAEAAVQQAMTVAQEFASAWSVVGGRFDFGAGMENAEAAKAELEVLLRRLLAQSLASPWICVKERLPEDGQEVLLYRPDAHLSQDPHYRITLYKNGKWDCFVPPTHWMPLPAAPLPCRAPSDQ